MLLPDGDVIGLGITGDSANFGVPNTETPISEGPVWLVARISGVESVLEAPPTTTTVAPASTTSTAPAMTATAGPGGTALFVVLALVVLGGAGLAVAAKNRST